MSTNQKTPRIPLPKGWKHHVRSAVLHVISLARYATVYTRSWAADSTNTRLRLKAQLDRANQEIALLREEMRIKDDRMARGTSTRHRFDSRGSEESIESAQSRLHLRDSLSAPGGRVLSGNISPLRTVSPWALS